MPRDNLVFVKTIRDVRNARDVWLRPIRTSQQVFRTRELVYPVDERPIAMALQKERRRFMKQTAALECSKKKIERVRAKFYAVGEKNRRLVALRYQLQKERWADLFSPFGKEPEPQKPLTHRVREIRIQRG